MTLFSILNLNNIFIFWLLIEFNVVIFLALILLSFKEEKFSDSGAQCLYYFIIQSLGSIIFLYFIRVDSTKNFATCFLLVAITLKLGLLPFQFWVVKLTGCITSFSLFFLLTLQKLPLIFFCFHLSRTFFIWILILNLLVGCLILYLSKTFDDLLVISRNTIFPWLIFSLTWSVYSFWIFFIKYSIFVYFLIKAKFNFFHFISTTSTKVIFLIVLIFMAGLPPLFFFFVKLMVISDILVFSSRFFFLILFVYYSFISLLAYFNFFYFFIFGNKSLYKNKKKFSFTEIFVTISCSVFFLIF